MFGLPLAWTGESGLFGRRGELHAGLSSTGLFYHEGGLDVTFTRPDDDHVPERQPDHDHRSTDLRRPGPDRVQAGCTGRGIPLHRGRDARPVDPDLAAGGDGGLVSLSYHEQLSLTGCPV
ncbi:MAG: hypothetical protein M5U12_14510 [Verrucomicrobia bacterium]|nr:hypothetical protein [Verrucomicrobiota bacterium]